MSSANEELRDLLISHQIGLQRLTNQQVKDILDILARSERHIRALIRERYSRLQAGDLGYGTKLRLNQMLSEIHEARRAATMQLYEPLASSLEDFAAYEQQYLAQTLRKAMPGGLADPTLASAELLAAIVRSEPFQGKLLHDHFRALTKRNGFVARQIRELVEEGLAMGASPVQVTRRIDHGALKITRANVQAITQTAMSHVTNTMRDGFVEGNTDVVKAVQWVGTLDSKICSICIVRDGHTYDPVTHAPIGDAPPWGAGPGRMHYNDRCTSVPVLKSWEEMGIDANELTGEQRASMDGFVDADTTAESWVARQGEQRLIQLFGTTRAGKLTSGEWSLGQLWSDDGTMYTLEQLAKEFDLT